MSGIKNTNQRVSDNYGTQFDLIFGNGSDEVKTGTYIYCEKTKKMMKIDSNIPRAVLDVMEPLTSTVSNVNPVNVKPVEL